MKPICESLRSCTKIGKTSRVIAGKLRSIIASVILLAFSCSLFGASFSGSGATFNINLNAASTRLSVVATSTGYTFTLSSGSWTGSATGATISGLNLTINATGLSTYDTFNITDSATEAAVSFNDSGANTYKDNFNINLDGDGAGGIPGIVTFNGTSSFIGSNAIGVVTTTNIVFNYNSILSTVNGNLTLDANTQLPYTTLQYDGIYLNNATVKATGTGTVVVKGRSGANSGSASNGIYIDGPSILSGGMAGALTVQGWGSANITDNATYGIYLSNFSTPTITSLGADVSVTGTAMSVNSTLSCIGISVGEQSNPFAGGIITSGGNGNVTVTGYGSSGKTGSGNYGIAICGSSSSITSGGTGLVKVLGYGGGSSTSSNNYGVYQSFGSTITSGAGGSVEVTGSGGTEPTGEYNCGVALNNSMITCGIGSGTVKVIGTGGGKGTSGRNYGMKLSGNSLITAGGSGTVAVTGQGGINVTGAYNYGIYLSNSSAPYPTISSNGGNVNVSGTGGGINNISNMGIDIEGGTITSGGLGTVTVSGQGGNQTGTSGNSNYGIYMNAFAGDSQITSNGGNITVNGIGGGGSGSSASSAINNHGLYLLSYAFIKPGGNGSVSVTGKGGNNSTGGSGGSNVGVCLSGYSAAKSIGTMVSSTNGDVTVSGTGGGDGGSGSGNYGVYVTSGAYITSEGTGTAVSVTGTGGNSSGSNNYGVQISGGTSPNFSKITSGGGNVTVNGTGGGVGGSQLNYGVNCMTGDRKSTRLNSSH